jgi:hypothetical protein
MNKFILILLVFGFTQCGEPSYVNLQDYKNSIIIKKECVDWWNFSIFTLKNIKTGNTLEVTLRPEMCSVYLEGDTIK